MPDPKTWNFKAPDPMQTEESFFTFGRRMITAVFTYQEDENRLKVDIDSGVNGTMGLEFNNIGNTDPLHFLIDLDWPYVRNEVFGMAGRSVDFLATIASLQTYLHQDEYGDHTREQMDKLRETLRTAVIGFTGDDELACTLMIQGLQESGFEDDTQNLFRKSQSEIATKAQRQIWEPFIEALVLYDNAYGSSPLVVEPEESDALEVGF